MFPDPKIASLWCCQEQPGCAGNTDSQAALTAGGCDTDGAWGDTDGGDAKGWDPPGESKLGPEASKEPEIRGQQDLART